MDIFFPAQTLSLLQGFAPCFTTPSFAYFQGSARHVMLFLTNPIRAVCIFNALRSCHCPRALLG